MITFLMVVMGIAFVLVSLFLILIVLIQPGGQRGGGLGGLGGGGAGGAISETLGATEGERTLARWTAVGMGVFFLLAIGLTVLGNLRTPMMMQLEDDTVPATAPGAGVADPEEPIGTEIQIPAEGLQIEGPEGIEIETAPPPAQDEVPLEALETED